jgi:CDP-diacylglycerol---glycerol-3-phosphate 3-phosphatidyltransferase
LVAGAFAVAALTAHKTLLLPLAVLVELSDKTDGIVARRTGTASDVGNLYDGMADFIAHMTQFIALAAIGVVGFGPVIVFLWAESLVVLAQRVACETRTRVCTGRISGKLKGVAQGACIVWLAATESAPAVAHSAGDWASTLLVGLAVTATALFGIDYVFAHRAALAASLASRGTTTD